MHGTKMAKKPAHNYKAANKASHRLVKTFNTQIKAKCTVGYIFYQ